MSQPLPEELLPRAVLRLTGEDDEPGNTTLRQDIYDELVDHLLSAANAERLKDSSLSGTSTDEARLWRRVLERFGDPAAVAGRLWLDANWEKVMTQRVTVAFMVLLMLVCVGMMAITWQSIAVGREAIRKAQVAAEQAQQDKQAILTQLAAMNERSFQAASANTAPAEWNAFQLTLVSDEPNGRPVEGATVEITGASPNTAVIPSAKIVTGADGKADFGKVLYGDYYLSITLPETQLNYFDKVGIRPGHDYIKTIPCPAHDDAPVSVDVVEYELPPEYQIPERLRGRIWYGLSFFSGPPLSIPREGDRDTSIKDGTNPVLGMWQSAAAIYAPGTPYVVKAFLGPDKQWYEAGKPVQYNNRTDYRNSIVGDDRKFLAPEGPFSSYDLNSKTALRDVAYPFPLQSADSSLVEGNQLRLPAGVLGTILESYMEVTGVDGQPCLIPIRRGAMLGIPTMLDSGHNWNLNQPGILSHVPDQFLSSLKPPTAITEQPLVVRASGANNRLVLVADITESLMLSMLDRLGPGETLASFSARWAEAEPETIPDQLQFFASKLPRSQEEAPSPFGPPVRILESRRIPPSSRAASDASPARRFLVVLNEEHVAELRKYKLRGDGMLQASFIAGEPKPPE